MKTTLILVLLLSVTLPGWAQDQIVLLRDTTRLHISVAELEKKYPPATTRLSRQNGVTAQEKGAFAGREKLFFDSVNTTYQRFTRFIDVNKRRLPVPGVVVQTEEFIRPDGTYDRVLCQFSGVDLTDEQEGRLLQLVAEWYGQHPFPLKTPIGFRRQNFIQLGSVPQKRTVRRGPGMISTLEAARLTDRPDTVTMLAFNQLNLGSVPEEVYRFPKLEELDLSRNNLNQLPARLTADIPTLKRLSVLYNAIPDDSVFITPNKHLLSLNLQGNRLTRVPRSVRYNRRLESLWLGNNTLAEVDTRTLRKLRRLTDLNLYNADLKQLPKGIGRLKKLNILDLYYNKLTELPRQMGRMKRLEQLAIAYNNLSELPVPLTRLRRLHRLYVHHNRLSRLPTEFKKLQNLRVLDLGFNWITVVPPVLASLPALEELDLNNNNIQEFPTVLTSMPSLKKVYLGSNPLFGREAMTSPYAGQIRQLQANRTEVFY